MDNTQTNQDMQVRLVSNFRELVNEQESVQISLKLGDIETYASQVSLQAPALTAKTISADDNDGVDAENIAICDD